MIFINSLILSAAFSEALSDTAPHYHDCHQIIYIAGGNADVMVADKSYRAMHGTLIFVSRLEQHSIQIKSPEYRRYTLQISPDFPGGNDEYYKLFSVLVNRPENFCHAVDLYRLDREIQSLLSDIVVEKRKHYPFYEKKLDSYFYDLLIFLYREVPELFCGAETPADGMIRQIQSRFETDYDRQFSLQQLADEFHLNLFYLSHLYKKVTGYSIINHLTFYRLAAAKKYLATTDTGIGTIVERCGFTDASNFSRTFKKEIGLTPSAFRKKYR